MYSVFYYSEENEDKSMWETEYAREPIDYRLFFLKLIKKLWAFPLAAVIGAILVGGIYCFVSFVISDGYQYRARTIYYVDYAEDPEGKEYEYYNYYTWQELIHTDYFVDGIREGMGSAMTDEMIVNATTAKVESDYRYLYTYSVMGDKQSAIDLEKAVSKVVTSFPGQVKEIESIEVVDPAGLDDIEDISLIFVKRAFIFGAIIGIVAACVISVFYACVDTSVYLPATLEKRFHIPAIGAPSMKEYETNCRHFLEGKKKVGFISVDEVPGNVKEVFSGGEAEVKLDIRSMKKLISQVSADSIVSEIGGDFEKAVIPNPLSAADAFDEIRSCDGLVIIVKAGAHNGKKTEQLIDQLSRMEIKPTAFILAGEDEGLIRAYYRG